MLSVKKGMARLIRGVSALSANTTTSIIVYQKELPEKVKKLKNAVRNN